MKTIIICLIIMGCGSPTESNTYQDQLTRESSRTRDCQLEIQPNQPLNTSGEYVCYVPHGHFGLIEVPIHYRGPERAEVSWTIIWLQANVSQLIPDTYPGPECRDEVYITVPDSFINYAATLVATSGAEADAVVLVIRKPPVFSSSRRDL